MLQMQLYNKLWVATPNIGAPLFFQALLASGKLIVLNVPRSSVKAGLILEIQRSSYCPIKLFNNTILST